MSMGNKVGSGTLAAAAALVLSLTSVVQAQQGQTSSAMPQPQVGLGIAIDENPDADGLKVGAVASGGTAAAIGVQAGDILLQLGGMPVRGPQSAADYVKNLKVGDAVSITVKRNGRSLQLNGKALPRPAPPPDRSTPVQTGELRETWNDRASQGTPAAATPEVNGWSLGTAMPLARAEHAVAELDGKIWVIGGWPAGRLTSNFVQVFDPATSLWSVGPSLPEPLHHTHAAAVDDKLFVMGGEVDGAATGRPGKEVANTWVHDPEVGGWKAAAPMPTARSAGGETVLDGKIYVAGGRAPGGSAFEVYDPATDTWEKLPDLPTQRNHLAMVALDGKVIVAGGRTTPGFTAERLAVVEIYDPKTRRWTNGAPLPASRGGITGAASGGCMFVFGGEGERSHVLGLTPDTYAYDLRTNTWVKLPDLPIAVHGLKGSAVIGGRIFLPGGGLTLGGDAPTNVLQIYRPTIRCDAKREVDR
jgi:N-acetylneuraminic acid mutarotase